MKRSTLPDQPLRRPDVLTSIAGQWVLEMLDGQPAFVGALQHAPGAQHTVDHLWHLWLEAAKVELQANCGAENLEQLAEPYRFVGFDPRRRLGTGLAMRGSRSDAPAGS